MDCCDYGPPNYLGHPAFQRVHSPGARSYYDNEQELSLDGLSLSEDQCTEDMIFWTKLSRKQSSRDGNRRGLNTKYQKPNKPRVVPRARGPAIDVALRNLDHELNASLKIIQSLVQCFEVDIESLQGWAEDLTLDTIWGNKVKKVFHEKRDKRKLEGMAARISDSKTAVKDAVKDARALKDVWEDKHALERQILTANKAVVFCDGIVGLAGRAARERLACKQLVVELEEARSLLDRKKHPWIYGEEEVEQQAGNTTKGNSPVKEAKRDRPNEGYGTGKEDDQGGLFDNLPNQYRKDTGGDQGGWYGWV